MNKYFKILKCIIKKKNKIHPYPVYNNKINNYINYSTRF